MVFLSISNFSGILTPYNDWVILSLILKIGVVIETVCTIILFKLSFVGKNSASKEERVV